VTWSRMNIFILLDASKPKDNDDDSDSSSTESDSRKRDMNVYITYEKKR
jgi:hypothetical protein